ncbi:MAG: hypothetical protein LBF25_03255 [Puniceicoccales bacterium]|nr:hypothetical protein [Puniceicoccales bacterium]
MNISNKILSLLLATSLLAVGCSRVGGTLGGALIGSGIGSAAGGKGGAVAGGVIGGAAGYYAASRDNDRPKKTSSNHFSEAKLERRRLKPKSSAATQHELDRQSIEIEKERLELEREKLEFERMKSSPER